MKKITIEADENTLRYLAFIVRDFFSANPAIDDDRVHPLPPNPEARQRDLMAQFAAQGIVSSEWMICHPQQHAHRQH